VSLAALIEIMGVRISGSDYRKYYYQQNLFRQADDIARFVSAFKQSKQRMQDAVGSFKDSATSFAHDVTRYFVAQNEGRITGKVTQRHMALLESYYQFWLSRFNSNIEQCRINLLKGYDEIRFRYEQLTRQVARVPESEIPEVAFPAIAAPSFSTSRAPAFVTACEEIVPETDDYLASRQPGSRDLRPGNALAAEYREPAARPDHGPAGIWILRSACVIVHPTSGPDAGQYGSNGQLDFPGSHQRCRGRDTGVLGRGWRDSSIHAKAKSIRRLSDVFHCRRIQRTCVGMGAAPSGSAAAATESRWIAQRRDRPPRSSKAGRAAGRRDSTRPSSGGGLAVKW
jgi:hypothetical protein